MENSEEIDRIERFLREVIIEELDKIQHAELTYLNFVLMGLSIEVLGAIFDNKPMKSKDQSAKRFSLAINRLFGGRYRVENEDNALYDKLRNQLTHTFLPGKNLLLLNNSSNIYGYRHLDRVDDQLVLISEDFFSDICKAVERVCEGLKNGKIKVKNIHYY